MKMEPSDGTRGNGHELKHRKFSLNTQKHFLPLRVTKHWQKFPSLEMFNSCVDMVQSNQLQGAKGSA